MYRAKYVFVPMDCCSCWHGIWHGQAHQYQLLLRTVEGTFSILWHCRVKSRETLHLEQLQTQVLHETGALSDRERGGVRFVELVGIQLKKI